MLSKKDAKKTPFQERCQEGCLGMLTLVCLNCNQLGVHGTSNKETFMCKKCFPGHLL
jgi:hypothetical protein